MVDTGGAARHPVDTERLMAYWSEGEGGAKIGWGIDGDFYRCEAELGKYVAGDGCGPLLEPSQARNRFPPRPRAGRDTPLIVTCTCHNEQIGARRVR